MRVEVYLVESLNLHPHNQRHSQQWHDSPALCKVAVHLLQAYISRLLDQLLQLNHSKCSSLRLAIVTGMTLKLCNMQIDYASFAGVHQKAARSATATQPFQVQQLERGDRGCHC